MLFSDLMQLAGGSNQCESVAGLIAVLYNSDSCVSLSTRIMLGLGFLTSFYCTLDYLDKVTATQDVLGGVRHEIERVIDVHGGGAKKNFSRLSK